MAITSAMLGAIGLIPSPNSKPNCSSNSTSLSHVKAQKCTQMAPKSVDNRLHPVVPLSVSVAIPSIAFFLSPEAALAAGGEFGILEGRTLALIHPIVMGSLFAYTLWAGYLGWQWRRVRTIQDEINELKKQVKAPAKEAAPVTAGGGSNTPAPLPPSPELSAVEAKIQQLTEERKELLKGSYRDRHFNAGSILLGFGVFESVGGGLNTWLRTGKLFPGPHLFAGAGITVLWALAAALVPAMQKGNETARNLHIALNTLNVVLFIWQIPTGFDIVLKVFEFTTWP
ncbi:plant/protein [Carex rostrata]